MQVEQLFRKRAYNIAVGGTCVVKRTPFFAENDLLTNLYRSIYQSILVNAPFIDYISIIDYIYIYHLPIYL